MKFDAKKTLSVVVLACCVGNSFADWGTTRQYSSPEISRMSNRIQTGYIYLSSREVEQRAKKDETSVANLFKKEILNEDEFMQKIRAIYCKGSSGTSLSVISFKQDIAEDLTQKEIDLTAQHDSVWIKQLGLGVVEIIGVGLAASRCRNGIDEVRVVVGGAVIVVGALGLWYMVGEKARLKTHISQVQSMEKDWKAFYVVPEQK